MTRYQYKKQKLASERGKRMASRRWELDAKKRELLARLDPINTKPIRRIIDIRGIRPRKSAFLNTTPLLPRGGNFALSGWFLLKFDHYNHEKHTRKTNMSLDAYLQGPTKNRKYNDK